MHVETSKNEVGDLMVSWEKSNTMGLVHPRTLVKVEATPEKVATP